MSKARAAGSVKKSSDWQLYLRLLGYIVPYWYIFLFSVCGYIVYSLGSVALADLMRFLLDVLNGVPMEESSGVASWAYHFYDPSSQTQMEFARIALPAVTIFLAFGRAMGFFVGTYFINHVARNLIHELRCQLFNKMQVAPSSYYDSTSNGVLISKITFNVEQVAGAATKALKIMVREGLVVAGLVTYMVYLNWRLCLVFLAVAPFIALVVVVVGRHFRRYSRRIQDSMGDVTQVTNESIGGYKEIRIFGGQDQQKARFLKSSEYNRVQSLKLAFADALSTPVIQTMLAAALAALIYFALSPDIMEGFSGSALVAFLTAAGQLGKPIRQLSSVQSIIQRGLAAAEDIFSQLDHKEEPDEGTVVVPRATGNVTIRDLSFSYPGSDRPALNGFSLEIPAGKTVALVGRSGSGKTTLVQLIARFYQAQKGSILLDNIPIEDYQLDNLRQQLAIVSQKVTLFHASVRSNIAYGSTSEADMERIEHAVKAAHASEFIDTLGEGYDTVLGEDGGGLSGGQRQRIAMARAILKDAPVLILDEATSALDNESEHRIQRALVHIMKDRTTIVIAHRLSTVENADLIVVMDQGEIVMQGSHSELLDQGGLYAQLYHQDFAD